VCYYVFLIDSYFYMCDNRLVTNVGFWEMHVKINEIKNRLLYENEITTFIIYGS
jgi:hypothetical protein